MTGPHLNDEEFSSFLLERQIDAKGARHLVACPLCRSEFERFTMLMADFNQDTLRWSEARIASSFIKPSFEARKRRPLVRWAMAACVLLIGLLSVMVAGRYTHHERASRGSVRPGQNSGEQIANDNRVLTGIYQEINAPVTVPMQEYGFPARQSKADSRVQ
jgi:hypothetical protein